MSGIQTIENDYLQVKIREHGAELWELWNKETKEQLIWDGRPEVWNRHAPVLFPFVGKCSGNQYSYDGRSYTMGQHGFARDMEFSVIDQGEDYVVHELCSSEETKKSYPFDFSFRVTHRLEQNCLLVSWEVENKDSHEMLFKIGGHPGFLLPEMENGQEYSLYFPGKGRLLHKLIDLPTGLCMADKTYELSLKDGCLSIGKHLFDQDALVFDDEQIAEVSILRPDSSKYLTFLCDGFPNMGIWAKPGAPFVCLEPWEGRCDNLGCTQELEKKPGLNHLQPGEVYKKSYEIKAGE